MSPLERRACLLLASLTMLTPACTAILGEYRAEGEGEGGAGGSSGANVTSQPPSEGGAGTTPGSMAGGGISTNTTVTTSGGGSCGNNMLDGTETDIDCGGFECLPCGLGAHCNDFDGNCLTGNCVDNACAPFSMTCINKMLDQTETDVDCGGGCPGCPPGGKCTVPSDCFFYLCNMGVCGFGP